MPVVLGLACVFLPYGSTQAVMAQAISSASATQEASLVIVFTIGTSIVFAILKLVTHSQLTLKLINQSSNGCLQSFNIP